MTAAQTTIKMSHKSFNNNVIDEKAEYKILPYSVTRKVLKQDELEEISGYDRHKDTAKESLLDGIKNLDVKTILQDVCPVLKWLPEYSIEKNLTGDIISGVTVVRIVVQNSSYSELIVNIPGRPLCTFLKAWLMDFLPVFNPSWVCTWPSSQH